MWIDRLLMSPVRHYWPLDHLLTSRESVIAGGVKNAYRPEYEEHKARLE